MTSKYRGAQGLDPEFIKSLEKQFGFDKPAYRALLPDALELRTLRFRQELFPRRSRVLQLIKEKLPVSISLGIWLTLLTYLISIPLGIRKAIKDGSHFDVWTSGVIIIGYAIPGFLFAILLIILFAGGSFFNIFPLRGLTSDNWAQLSLPAKIARLFLASGAADHLHGAGRVRHHDAAHQELVPRRDPQAIRAHRARQRLHASARCSTAMSSATPC